MATDKACRLAHDIAQALFPLRTPKADSKAPAAAATPAPAPTEQQLALSKGLCYLRYRRVLMVLCSVLEQATPEYADKQKQMRRAARIASDEKWSALTQLPLTAAVTQPEPEPVVPCALEDLEPLIAFLKKKVPVAAQTEFHKGTLLPDGRLDLCKQVVGPKVCRV
jgi:hypothetical protein